MIYHDDIDIYWSRRGPFWHPNGVKFQKKIQHFSHDLVVRHDGNRSHGLRKALLPKVSSFFCCEGGMEKLDAPNDQIFYPNISKISSKTGWCFQVKFRRYSAKDLSWTMLSRKSTCEFHQVTKPKLRRRKTREGNQMLADWAENVAHHDQAR